MNIFKQAYLDGKHLLLPMVIMPSIGGLSLATIMVGEFLPLCYYVSVPMFVLWVWYMINLIITKNK